MRQFGPYLLWVFENSEDYTLVREDQENSIPGVPVVFSGQRRVATSRRDNRPLGEKLTSSQVFSGGEN